MLVKCICTNCAGHLEFEEENAGQKIDCPHCGFETTLFLPGTRQPDEILESLAKRFIRRRRLEWTLGTVGALGVLCWALYRWGLPLVQDLFPSVESKVICGLILALFCLVIPCACFWLVLPIFVFFQSRKLMRVLGQIEANLRPESEELAEGERDTVRVAREDLRKL